MEKKADLVITDVPEQTLKQFKEYANKYFKPKYSTAHYGFALKWLMDFYLGVIGKGHERAENLALQALEELREFRNEVVETKEQPKQILSVNGNVIKVN